MTKIIFIHIGFYIQRQQIYSNRQAESKCINRQRSKHLWTPDGPRATPRATLRGVSTCVVSGFNEQIVTCCH